MSQTTSPCRAPITCARLYAMRARVLCIQAKARMACNVPRYTQCLSILVRIDARLELATYFPYVTSQLTAYETGYISEAAKAAYARREEHTA